MTRALWKGTVIAESDNCIEIEGNQYFPPHAVRRDHLRPAETHTFCPWKGAASYYDVVIDGEVNTDAAWYYPDPLEAVTRIRDYVAFWHDVEIEA